MAKWLGCRTSIRATEEKLASARGKASQLAKENREAVAADLEAKRLTAEAEDQERMAAAEERISAMKAEAMAQIGRFIISNQRIHQPHKQPLYSRFFVNSRRPAPGDLQHLLR